MHLMANQPNPMTHALADAGLSILASRPEVFRRFVPGEVVRWGRAVKTSGVTLN